MLIFILNAIHMLLIFVPIIIYFIKQKYLKPWFKFYVIFSIITPLHWIFFNNKCALTLISRSLGDKQAKKSGFSEKYLKWLYKPLMKYVFNLKWNSDGIAKMVNIHWIFNFILLWYFIFYKYVCK